MTLMNIISIQYFTKNSFSGGLILEQNFPQSLQFLNTVNSLVSGHPRELKNVSVSRAVRLRELFP